MAGAYDVVVAAGVEVMTRCRWARRSSRTWTSRSHRQCSSATSEHGLPPQGIGAEMIADEWGLTRDDLDAFGAARQQPRRAGHRRGPLRERDRPGPGHDDGTTEIMTRRRGHPPRHHAGERSANLKPAFKEDGKITAGNSSQITDGASAVLIMSDEKAAELGLRPRARFHSFAVAGTDPVTMLKGPIPATEKILRALGPVDRRHRPVRGQRGLRVGRARLAEGDRRRHGRR